MTRSPVPWDVIDRSGYEVPVPEASESEEKGFALCGWIWTTVSEPPSILLSIQGAANLSLNEHDLGCQDCMRAECVLMIQMTRLVYL